MPLQMLMSSLANDVAILSSKICAGAMDWIRSRLLFRDSLYDHHPRSAGDLSVTATAVTIAYDGQLPSC